MISVFVIYNCDDISSIPIRVTVDSGYPRRVHLALGDPEEHVEHNSVVQVTLSF